MRTSRWPTVLLVLCATTALASADEFTEGGAPPVEPSEPSTAPIGMADPAAVTKPLPPLVTLDRMGGHSYAGADLGFTTLTGVDGQALRLELHGQWMVAETMGVYVSAPFSYVGVEGDSESALQNFDVGGVTSFAAAPDIDVYLRGGIVLPTNRAEGADAFIGSIAGIVRLGDLAQSAPKMTTLRASASPVWRQGNLFVRGDVGLDVPVHNPNGDNDPVGRVSFAGGGVFDPVMVAGEVVTLISTDSDNDERFLHTVAATFRYVKSDIQPHFAFIVPTDDTFSQFLDLTLIIGATTAL